MTSVPAKLFLAMCHAPLAMAGAYLLSSDSLSYPKDYRSANEKTIPDRIQRSKSAC
jgi:hypothetical protein